MSYHETQSNRSQPKPKMVQALVDSYKGLVKEYGAAVLYRTQGGQAHPVTVNRDIVASITAAAKKHGVENLYVRHT